MLDTGFLPNSPCTHACTCGRCKPLVKISASWFFVGTLTSRISPFWITSWAKCFRMSMCRVSLIFNVSTRAPNGASRAVGTHHGPTRIHAPTGAYAIGGTATLAQRCSIISATAAARTLPTGMTAGRRGCWGWAPPPLPPGPQDLPRNYGPDGAAGGLKPEFTAASGPRTYGSGPTTGTRSQTTCYVRRGTGRVIYERSI